MAPRLVQVESEDAAFQRLDALRRNRNLRHRLRLFPVEGVRQINVAIANGWRVRSLVHPGDRSLSDWATRVLDSSEADTRYVLPSKLHDKLSNKRETSELIALVEMPADDLQRIPLGTPPLVLVFDRPGSPGNLGTLIRSCDALGADGLILTGHAVDLYDPQTIAASTGSLFALPVVRLESHEELDPMLDRIKANYGDLQIVGTSAHAERSVFECSFWRPTLLLIGNETHGLSHAYSQLADVVVSIPMRGSASSLNVASAATILLYEAMRQRRG